MFAFHTVLKVLTRQTQNTDVDVHVDVESHPVGSSTLLNQFKI